MTTTSFKLDTNDTVQNLLKRTLTAPDCYDYNDTFHSEHQNQLADPKSLQSTTQWSMLYTTVKLGTEVYSNAKLSSSRN